MNVIRMIFLTIPLILCFPIEAFSHPSTFQTRVAGESYACITQHQAAKQHINPDYLVPGCHLYARKHNVARYNVSSANA